MSRQLSSVLGSVTLVLCLTGCAEPTRSISADPPRSSTPLPACVLPLPPRGDAQRGFVRQLSEDEIWHSVFPSYDAMVGVPDGALTCTAEPIFGHKELTGSTPRHPFPFKPKVGDLRFGSAPNRVKIVWFKTHGFGENDVVGPLALGRGTEDFGEVYAIGVYRGHGEQSRFSTERLGGQLAVVAYDDRCAGKPETEDCESTMQVFVAWKGQLLERAKILLEKRTHLAGGEPGAEGPLLYRLVSSPTFEDRRIRLLEQISATDPSNRKLRTMELERHWQLEDGKLIESAPSLWEKMLPRADATTTPVSSESSSDAPAGGAIPASPSAADVAPSPAAPPR